MTSLYSDAALRQYAGWTAGHLKFSWDSSRAGSKMQAVPARMAQDWLIRNQNRLRVLRDGTVVLQEGQVDWASILIGAVAGFALSKLIKW